MDFDVKASLSCNASPVGVLQDEVITFISGNCITFWNLARNEKDYIWCENFSLTTCAANARLSQVAVGTESKAPEIQVYSYPEKKLLYSLQGRANLHYTAMAWSRDGKRLVTVGDYPDYTLEVW
jgi:hypothetical protein